MATFSNKHSAFVCIALLVGVFSPLIAESARLSVRRGDILHSIRGVAAAQDIKCGSKSLNHTDFDAARAELEKLCDTGPLPAHQNLYRKHGSMVAFLCSFGAGGNPGEFPKEENKTCVTPITNACGAYTAGWVISRGLNITYGLDAANTTICERP
ncbi:hypothetical protein GQ53DRAFT_818496 [Thozetella sp. PMI_491]|nr:hypothetical protein GQ53DRAFT_818496 [Thozetella sp. PMI_491]